MKPCVKYWKTGSAFVSELARHISFANYFTRDECAGDMLGAYIRTGHVKPLTLCDYAPNLTATSTGRAQESGRIPRNHQGERRTRSCLLSSNAGPSSSGLRTLGRVCLSLTIYDVAGIPTFASFDPVVVHSHHIYPCDVTAHTFFCSRYRSSVCLQE